MLLGGQVRAQRPDALFVDDGPVVADLPPAAAASGTSTRRARMVGVRRDRLDGAAGRDDAVLTVNLFADVTLDAVGERVERDDRGRTTWVGHAAGDPMSVVVLTWNAAGLTGQVSAAGRLYAIEPRTAGSAMVRELEPVTPPLELPARLPPGGRPAVAFAPAPAAGTPPVIDLLVLYTSAARKLAGGLTPMDAQVASAVAVTNAALQRSGVQASLRTVGAREFFYVESLGGLGRDLDEISPGGSMASLVAQMRSAAGADLVALITGRTGSLTACGVAWLGPAPAAVFNVTEFACLGPGQWSFSHEIGHSFGADHAPGDPVISPVPYARGYRDGKRIRTLMAYPVPGSPPRVLNFSSAVVREPPATGDATGTSLQDNARQIGESAATVAAFMGALGAPDTPTGLTASAVGSAVTLTWNAPLGGAPVSDYELDVGSVPGAADHGRFVLNASPFTFPSVGHGRYYARLRSRGPGGVSPFAPEIVVDVGPVCLAPGTASVRASVAGTTVTLQWQATPGTGATSYLVGLGTTPGGLELGITPVGTLTDVTVPAPPGRYYVRVAGQNACGLGPISAEILVSVP